MLREVLLRSRYIAGLTLYGVGTASLLGTDLLVSTTQPNATVAEWALLKGLLLLAITVAPLGLDQVIVRLPDQRRWIYRTAAFLGPGFAALLSGGLWLAGLLTQPWLFVAAVILSLPSSFAVSSFRADGQIIAAQGSYATWRFVLFATLALSYVLGHTAEFPVATLIATAVGATFSLAISFTRKIKANHGPAQYKECTHIASFMLFDIALLNLTLYAEQFFFHINGHEVASAAYFRHVTFIVSPIIMLNTYVVFVLAPAVRRVPERFLRFGRSEQIALVAAAAVYATALGLVGAATYASFAGQGAPSVELAVGLAIIGLLRTIQAVAGIPITIFSQGQERRSYLFGGYGALAAFAAIAAVGSGVGLPPITTALSAALCTWLLRAAQSVALANRIRKRLYAG